MHVSIDRAKADEVFSRLVARYRARIYPYNLPKAKPPNRDLVFPDDLRDNKEAFALFLFKLCYWMRGKIQSDTAAISLQKLRSNGGAHLFDPWLAKDMQLVPVAEQLIAAGLGVGATDNARFWIENSRRLAEQWDAKVLNIFAGVTDYDDACSRVIRDEKKGTGFYGFRHKMVSMLIHYLADEDLITPFMYPIPVDFHVCRILVATQIVTVDEMPRGGLYTPPVLAAIRKLSIDYCAANDVDPIDLCNAIWLYSRLMCRMHPGNKSSVAGKYNGRRTDIRATPVKWTTAVWRAFDRTCGRCKIAEHCTLLVPNAPYQYRGILAPRGTRTSPPGRRLLPIVD